MKNRETDITDHVDWLQIHDRRFAKLTNYACTECGYYQEIRYRRGRTYLIEHHAEECANA